MIVAEQETPVHNRWHPDIPPVATVAEGDVFRVETIDWTGGQIKNNDSADDVKNVDLTQVHYLSGPIAVPTAEVGDLLKAREPFKSLHLQHYMSLIVLLIRDPQRRYATTGTVTDSCSHLSLAHWSQIQQLLLFI